MDNQYDGDDVYLNEFYLSNKNYSPLHICNERKSNLDQAYNLYEIFQRQCIHTPISTLEYDNVYNKGVKKLLSIWNM